MTPTPTPLLLDGTCCPLVDPWKHFPDLTRRAHAFDTEAIGLAVVSLEGRCIDINAALCTMLGRTRQDMLNRSMHDLTYADDLRPGHALMHATLAGERDGYSLRKRYIARDGDLVWARLTVSLIRDRHGAPSHFISVIEDQSALHSAEEKALSAERHFKETLNQTAVGVVLTSPEGRFLSINTYFATLLGYQPDDLVGHDYRTYSVPDDVKENAPRRSARWDGKLDRVVAEKRWLHRNGTHIWTRMTISIARELERKAPYSIAIVEDITAEKAYAESQRLLVGELNHRVKNTLAMVQGMVRKTLSNAADLAQATDLIESRLQSISIAHDLLSKCDWRDLDLKSLVQRTIADVFPAHLPAIRLDCPQVALSPQEATTLALIFHELTTNAIKHGALQAEAGLVALSAWTVQTEPDPGAPAGSDRAEPTQTLHFQWRETGGACPDPSNMGKGFGTFLLKRGISHSLNGQASHCFTDDGLVVDWSFPLMRTESDGTPYAQRLTPRVAISADDTSPL